MISLRFNTAAFNKEMKNIMDYSFGFLEGLEYGKAEMYRNLGPEITEIVYGYIDSNARVSPQTLHHIYEWYQIGSPESRLYDINYSITSTGLKFSSSFKQSTTIKDGSKVPFYSKAQIMESGTPVTIAPRKAKVLAFDIDGQTIFTPNSVTIDNPGGQSQGQFAKVLDSFFSVYFKQSFLKASGLSNHFKNAKVFKENIRAGARGGRSVGVSTGSRWVATASLGKVS